MLINSQNEPPSLLRRHNPPDGSWIILELAGVESNRSAIGARVALLADGREQIDEVRGGGSYLSHNDLRLHFGLGGAKRVDRVEIRWPTGGIQTLSGLEVRKVHRIVESD